MITDQQKRELVERIADSASFRRAPRLREFFLYVSHRAIEDPRVELSEYDIGFQVFKKPPSFNPSDDSIVRSSARQLRQKLSEYYQSDGRADEWIVEIPKGAYVPVFSLRSAAPAPTAGKRPAWRWRTAAIAGAAALAVLWIVMAVKAPRKAASHEPANLLAWLVGGRKSELSVVLPDSALNVVNSHRDQILTLEDYLRFEEQRKPPWEGVVPKSSPPFPGGRLITGFRDVLFLERLRGVATEAGIRIETRHSRLMQLREFREGNYLVLGDGWSNPWALLFQQGLNFRYEQQPGGVYGIRNQAPLAGERDFYTCTYEQARDGFSYATIAITPNLSESGIVILAGGLRTEGNEGKFDALLSSELFRSLDRSIRSMTPQQAHGLELLIEIKAKDGVANRTRLVAVRHPNKG